MMCNTQARYGSRLSPRCNGRQQQSLVKDPTAATTTINDETRRPQ
ncbi:hypothetical protein OK016_19310 [Vibrio chagasii]|nr:hypothetical protein [Vibrio chagasii]